LPILEKCCENFPDAVWSLFNSRIKFEDKKSASPYIKIKGYGMYGVGIVFPKKYVNDFFDFQTECVPEGFKMMVSPILILTFAWTLSGMTGLLGADIYVADLVSGSAQALEMMLPAIIFLVALGLAFATGTSWGTFGILIPIVMSVYAETGGEILIISISACLAGAVCGDHCSPISDTTILASAGAQSNHVNHVSTQLPYALIVAVVSFVSYVFAGIFESIVIGLVTGLVVLAIVFVVMYIICSKQKEALGDNNNEA
jgi:Na+/H+ antiporter NhaC